LPDCVSPFDGSQDWVIAHNDVVAGSSPASGTKCRSSSVVEHVIPSSFLIRRFFQRAVDCGFSWIASGASSPCRGAVRGCVMQAHRAIPQSPSCPLLLLAVSHHFDGPKLWVIACCWFESNPRRNSGVIPQRSLPIQLSAGHGLTLFRSHFQFHIPLADQIRRRPAKPQRLVRIQCGIPFPRA
jgi:hypothetical protein